MHISEAIIIAIIAAIPGMISSIILGLRNHDAIKEVHIALNSRLTELVEASIDKGKIQERTEQRAILAEIPIESKVSEK
jgi:hypothetical protein